VHTARTCTAEAGTTAFSFSAAAAPLPAPVLEQVREDLERWRDAGRSVLDLPFGSDACRALSAETEVRLRRLLALPDSHHVLFLQGGAYLHFTAVALNLLGAGGGADYVHTGLWSTRAAAEAARCGPVRVAASAAASGFDHVPDRARWRLEPGAAYCHVTSNETAHGVQFPELPDTGPVPLAADVSSDFLTRPLPFERLGLAYASAQKSAGIAGLTVVVIRDALLHRALAHTPAPLNYTRQVQDGPVNTPPVFAIYVAGRVLAWLEDQGGTAAMAQAGAEKSALLYAVVDTEPVYRCRVRPAHRSRVSVCFDLCTPDLLAGFLAAARARGFAGLDGHGARGGVRVSLHNTVPRAQVEALAEFMRAFARRHTPRGA